MNNYGELMVYALRYSLGRLTYAPNTVRDEIYNNIVKFDNNDLMVMSRDVSHWLKHDKVENTLVEKDEVENWTKFLNFINETLETRKFKKEKAVVFDIDGTISDASERLHHIHDKPRNYIAFHSECINDKPIEPTLNILRYYLEKGYKVILLTRRPKYYREQSEQWLSANGVQYHSLVMCEDTYTSAIDYKREEIRKLKHFYHIEAVFEDQMNLAQMFREEGLFVFDVGGVEIKK